MSDKRAGDGDKVDTDLELLEARGRISLGKKTFNSLRNPVYRLYFGGILGQRASMNMQMVARSLLIYEITGSAAILGGMALAYAFPMLLLSLFGGVIADRVHKKYVLIAGLIFSALVALGVALFLTAGLLSPEKENSWWILVGASLLQGIIHGLMIPSRQAIIREIVSEEELLNAVSMDTLGMNIFRLLAPAATGFLIDAFDFEAVYYVMTGMYLLGLLSISFMPLTGTMTIRGGGALADIKEGFDYIRREPVILTILLFTLFAVLFSMPYMRLLPIFAIDILKIGNSGMGILMSVAGIGALIGSLALASLPNKKRGVLLLSSGLVMGLALVGFASSSSLPLSLGLIVFVGLGQAGRMTLANTLLQYYTEDRYRGRVMSIYMMEFGLTSFGAFGAGLLAEAAGVQWAVGGFAMVLVTLSTLALLFLPRLRKLD
jgi:MFS family permease